jgi:hypothetical protein
LRINFGFKFHRDIKFQNKKYFKTKNVKRYVGSKDSSSMAIVSLRLPTGWIADEGSIESLRNLVDLRRHELDENKVNLYFDEVILLNLLFRKKLTLILY